MAEPLDRQLEKLRDDFSHLHELVERLLSGITRHDEALQKLEAAFRDGSGGESSQKALRQAMVHQMASHMLREQIAEMLPAMDTDATRLSRQVGARLKQFRSLEALSRTAEAINSTLDLAVVLEQVMDMLVDLTGAERGYLMLLNDSSGRLELQVARNLDRETIASSEFEISRTIVQTVVNDGEAVITTNAQADPRFSAEESIVGYNLRSILCAPLKVKNKLIGIIYADNRIKTGLFSKADRDLLAAFANVAAVAIDNARLFENITAAKNLMQNVFSSITSAVITVAPDSRITLFNRAAERMFSLAAAACLDKPSTDIFAATGTGITELISRVMRDRQPLTDVELTATLARGRAADLRLSLSPLTDDHQHALGVAVVIDDFTEKKRFEKERAMVKRYLPAQLVDSLADLQDLQLGGARQEVTILFADIRGFTSYSEQRDPTEVVMAINTLFSLVHQCIQQNDGIVDKYMGDAVMAHYNSPLQLRSDHAWLAIKSAWEAIALIEAKRREYPVISDLRMGIGVHTGVAVAGNIGAHEHMDYTLMGDAVNLAKRLQENARAKQILIGERTYNLAKDRIQVNRLEPLKVKGRSAYEQVFELTGIGGAQ